jgi:hypothetical protein
MRCLAAVLPSRGTWQQWDSSTRAEKRPPWAHVRQQSVASEAVCVGCRRMERVKGREEKESGEGEFLYPAKAAVRPCTRLA